METSTDLFAPPAPRPMARWRWWVYLLFIGSYPIALALTTLLRPARAGAKTQVALPASVNGLLLVGALEIASLLLFFGVAWMWTRPSKDQLWLRWRGGFGPVWRGALYSIGLRFLPVISIIAVSLVLATFGVNGKTIEAWIKDNQPQTGGIADAVRAGSALYRLVMLTFLSFVVAGLREELWRVATMRGLLEVVPRAWSSPLKNAVAVGVSAGVFGFGHWYQGVLGVALTTIIGLALGAVTLHHRSVWPAVIAHGFFDATSFLMVIWGVDKLAGAG